MKLDERPGVLPSEGTNALSRSVEALTSESYRTRTGLNGTSAVVDEKMEALPSLKPSWIWCGNTEEDCNIWAWARRHFGCSETLKGALSISADLRYMVWINGRRIGFGPPKFHAATPTVDRYDITPFLQKGKNLVVVCVYSLGPAQISSCSPQRGGLWVDLEVDGRNIVTDGSWKMQRDPGYSQKGVAIRGTHPPGELYDARIGLGAVMEPSFDDSDWPAARTLDSGNLQLESRDIPFMFTEIHLPDRLVECGIARFLHPHDAISIAAFASEVAAATHAPDREGRFAFSPDALSQTEVSIKAADLPASDAAYLLWDLGKIWTGYPVIRVRGTKGTVLNLSYGEHLHEGKVNPAKSMLHYFDRMILGESPLEHRITWPKSARYVQLHVHGGDATVERLCWERSTYPVRRQGAFNSDSPVLDQAVEISLHTVQLCMEDSYMDTPWRERGSWLGDDLLKAQTAYSYFRDYALARRFLIQHTRGQRSNGMLQGKYPGNTTSDVSTWTLRFPSSLLEYCAESGDWDLAHALWPNVLRILDWLRSLKTPHQLFQAPPVHVDAKTNRYNFIDWSPVDMRGINAAWNAFAQACLRSAYEVGLQIGKEAEAREIRVLADNHRRAFQNLFWDERRGIYANGRVNDTLTERWGCHENCLAVLFDLATEEQTNRIIERLKTENLLTSFTSDPRDYDEELEGLPKIPTVSLALSKYRWPAEKMVPIGTPYFAAYMLEALCKLGMVAQATQYIEHHWGNFSKMGGTTGWETWNMGQSLSHGWACAPAIFAARTLLGVQRRNHSGDQYQILPHLEEHKMIRGRVATRAGDVEVHWDGNILNVDIPEGLEFIVGLPAREKGKIFLNGIAVPGAALRQNQCSYQSTPVPPGRHRMEIRICED